MSVRLHRGDADDLQEVHSTYDATEHEIHTSYNRRKPTIFIHSPHQAGHGPFRVTHGVRHFPSDSNHHCITDDLAATYEDST